MISIRTITRPEAEEFLAILCQSFDIEPKRARAVFFSEPLFDLDRKWALFDGPRMASILTTAPLLFGHGPAIGIAGVATIDELRGQGLGTKLVDHVVRAIDMPALLFAHDSRLYESAGFELIDQVIRGKIATNLEPESEPDGLENDEVQQLYEAWSQKSPDRLIRDEQRWRYWRWVTRACERFQDGYLCLEPALCREAVLETSSEAWPVSPGTDWYGLRTMTDNLAVPIEAHVEDLLLMARGFDFQPQMFMTDQF